MIKVIKGLLSLLIVGSGITASAQQDYTLYHMRYVPQSSFTNAAFTPEAKVYVGLPGLSGLYFSASNNGFKWSDLLRPEDTPGAEKALVVDAPNALSKMKKLNLFSQEFRADIINFGLKVGNNHFAFNISTREKFSIAYTRDMFGLLLIGNGLTAAESQAEYGTEDFGYLGGTADLSGTGVNFTQFQEIGIKYSRTFLDEKLSIGARPKILLGSVNLQSKKTDLTLSTDEETFALTTTGGMEINTSLPAAFTDSDGFGIGDLGFADNKGFGLDLGATYLITEQIELSASINDLGFIRWANNPKNYITDDFEITFKGISGFEDELISGNNPEAGTDTVSSTLSEFADSLVSTITPDTTYEAYSAGIGANFNIGGRYAFTKRHSVAALLSGRMVARQFKPALSLSYNFRLYKWLGVTAAYNAYSRSYTNLGMGLSFNLFPVQFHIITDNIWAISPATTRAFHARFGINLVFGHDKGDMKEKRNF